MCVCVWGGGMLAKNNTAATEMSKMKELGGGGGQAGEKQQQNLSEMVPVADVPIHTDFPKSETGRQQTASL